MDDVRGTAAGIPTSSEPQVVLGREVRRLRRTVQALIVSQGVTLLAVLALAAAVERRSVGLRDAVWDAAEKAERAAREELPGAVTAARGQLREFEERLAAIDARAQALDASLAPGGEVAKEARRLSGDLERSVRDTVREVVRREVAQALEEIGEARRAEAAAGEK